MPTLKWIGKKEIKNHHNNIEYRVLDCKESVGDENSGNLIVKGDNLLALKSLLPYYAGQVKMIYIDPPYNTGNEDWQYNDNVNSEIINRWFEDKTPINKEDLTRHDKWLCMMYPRLKLLEQFLSEDGYICVHIDDSESANLKLLLDSIFGQANHELTYYIQVRYPNKTLKEDMVYNKLIEQVHVYRASRKSQPNRKKILKNIDKYIFYFDELKEPIDSIELGGKRIDIFEKGSYKIKKNEASELGRKEIWASGSVLDGNSSGRFFRDYLTGLEKQYGYGLLYKVYNIGDDSFEYRYFTSPNAAKYTRGKYYQGIPTDHNDDIEKEVPIQNFWDFAPSFGNCNNEGGVFFKSGKKPEAFLKMLMETYSNEGDLILDSFGGSGSTAATAHKMKRNWITIEMEDHAETHILQRLTNVVNGDKTAISEEVNWQGGGGFQFCELSEPLFDELGLLDERIEFDKLSKHLYFIEFGIANTCKNINAENFFAGNYLNRALYVYLDETFDREKLQKLEKFDKYIVYADLTTLSDSDFKDFNIEFKKIPFDIRGK
jgi:adenine-specific DNA-methyltransferase